MKKRLKKLSKRATALIVCAAIVGSIAIVCLSMQIAFMQADKIKCWTPSYEKADISAMLDAPEAERDYALLYRQTGLTKAGIDRCLERSDGKRRILDIQSDYFGKYEVENGFFAPFVCTDYIDKYISHVFLEDGDIIVTSSTHFSGWRIGHAGLVTDGDYNRVIQASAYGSTSEIGNMGDFTDRVNFMVLRVKDEYVNDETRGEIAKYAAENLCGKKYDISAGVLSSKNKVKRTQCAHLVWYAYKQFGIDIDGNGGPVVTPRNIANSPKTELLQVFGFDTVKLWR